MKSENQYKSVNASFGTIENLMDKQFIKQLLELIEKYAKPFSVKGYHLVNKIRLKPLDYNFIAELWQKKELGGDSPWIYFVGDKPYNFELSVRVEDNKIFRDRYNMSSISVSVNRAYFVADTSEERKYRQDKYLEVCNAVYKLTKPLCGECHDVDDEHAIRASLSKGGISRFLGFAYSIAYGTVKQPHIDCPIAGVYWGNYFGPSCVKFFGREKLADAPGVVRREDLDGGGMLLFTAPHPLTPDDPLHRKNQIALWDYLGLKPRLNLKVIAKYKSSNPWEGSKANLE